MALTRYYLTARMGFGQSLRLETIDRKLANMPIRAVLCSLSRFSRLADQAGTDPYKLIELARQFLPSAVEAKVAKRLNSDSNAVFTSSQVILNLVLRALVNCSLEERNQFVLADVDQELGMLALAQADHLGGARQTHETVTLELTRMGLFAHTPGPSDWLEITVPLFFEIPPNLTSHPDWVDVNALFVERFGYSLAKFWTITFHQGIHAQNIGNPLELAIPISNVSRDELTSWSNVLGISLADAQQRAKEDLECGTGWSFTAFLDSPLLEIEPGQFIAMRPA